MDVISELSARLASLEKRVGKRKGATHQKGAAEYLGVSEETLRRMQERGEGPRRHRHGRFWMYTFEDLDAYLAGDSAA